MVCFKACVIHYTRVLVLSLIIFILSDSYNSSQLEMCTGLFPHPPITQFISDCSHESKNLPHTWLFCICSCIWLEHIICSRWIMHLYWVASLEDMGLYLDSWSSWLPARKKKHPHACHILMCLFLCFLTGICLMASNHFVVQKARQNQELAKKLWIVLRIPFLA